MATALAVAGLSISATAWWTSRDLAGQAGGDIAAASLEPGSVQAVLAPEEPAGALAASRSAADPALARELGRETSSEIDPVPESPEPAPY